MTITLNGQPHDLAGPCTVADLLASLGFADRPVVVELDESALLPREYSGRKISAGARLEIVTIAAGG